MAKPVIKSSGATTSSAVAPASLGFLVTVVSGAPTTWEWHAKTTPLGLLDARGVNGDFVNGCASIANPRFFCMFPGGYLFQVRAWNTDGWSDPTQVEFGAASGALALMLAPPSAIEP